MPIVAGKVWLSSSVRDGGRLWWGLWSLFTSLWTRKQRKSRGVCGGGGRTFTEDLLPPAGPHFPEAPQLPKRVLLAGKYVQNTSLWEAGQILHPNKRF